MKTPNQKLQDLRKELAIVTRDRDENVDWRRRLHAEINELKRGLSNSQDVVRATAESFMQERAELLARAERLRLRIMGLGFTVPEGH